MQGSTADGTRTVPRARAPLRLRLLAAVVAAFAALAALEVLLHLSPRLLPEWFRERYPPHGVEFFHRGVLDRTPLDALPLPLGVEPYAGPPPHDLVDRGFASAADAEIDRRDVPHI